MEQRHYNHRRRGNQRHFASKRSAQIEQRPPGPFSRESSGGAGDRAMPASCRRASGESIWKCAWFQASTSASAQTPVRAIRGAGGATFFVVGAAAAERGPQHAADCASDDDDDQADVRADQKSSDDQQCVERGDQVSNSVPFHLSSSATDPAYSLHESCLGLTVPRSAAGATGIGSVAPGRTSGLAPLIVRAAGPASQATIVPSGFGELGAELRPSAAVAGRTMTPLCFSPGWAADSKLSQGSNCSADVFADPPAMSTRPPTIRVAAPIANLIARARHVAHGSKEGPGRLNRPGPFSA